MTNERQPQVRYEERYPTADADGISDIHASAIALLARDFIVGAADQPDLRFEEPELPLDAGGPEAYPPGFHDASSDKPYWTIAYEGAYGWTFVFAPLVFEEGPVGDYCRANAIDIEIQAGYMISLHRADRASES